MTLSRKDERFRMQQIAFSREIFDLSAFELRLGVRRRGNGLEIGGRTWDFGATGGLMAGRLRLVAVDGGREDGTFVVVMVVMSVVAADQQNRHGGEKGQKGFHGALSFFGVA